jgi:hypothetical protein
VGELLGRTNPIPASPPTGPCICRINWKKFEVMGEVILSIQKAQATPYPAIAKNEEVRALVLDGKIMKDEDVSEFLCFPPLCTYRLP